MGLICTIFKTFGVIWTFFNGCLFVGCVVLCCLSGVEQVESVVAHSLTHTLTHSLCSQNYHSELELIALSTLHRSIHRPQTAQPVRPEGSSSEVVE